MRNFGIQHKLLISFIGVALLSIPLNIYLMVNFNNITQHFLTLTDAQSKSLRALLEMQNTSLHASLITNNFNYGLELAKGNIHTPSPLGATKDELLAYLEEIGEWQKVYQQNLILTDQADFIGNQLTTLRESVILKALDVFSAKEQNMPKDILLKKITALEQSQDQLEAFIRSAINSETERLTLIKYKADKNWFFLQKIAAGVSFFIIFIACLLGYFLSHWIARPIIFLRNFTYKINPNNLKERTPIQSNDEIGELAISINTMLENLQEAKAQIIETSRLAGIAEMATSILHNMGNLLNSITTSVTLITEQHAHSKIKMLPNLYELLQENKDNLDEFITNNERGKRVLPYFQLLVQSVEEEHVTLEKELKHLKNNLNHINQLITTQLSFKMALGVEEQLKLSDIFEYALNLQKLNIEKHNIKIEYHYEEVPEISIVKSKLVQILVNLVKNAVEALILGKTKEKLLVLSIKEFDNDFICITVQDNGMGILKEHLEKIFSFGFTTKENGHGYGMHSCSILAKELGGSLTAESEGLEQGARFTLKIPKN